jgi:hypothetical protein
LFNEGANAHTINLFEVDPSWYTTDKTQWDL